MNILEKAQKLAKLQSSVEEIYDIENQLKSLTETLKKFINDEKSDNLLSFDKIKSMFLDLTEHQKSILQIQEGRQNQCEQLRLDIIIYVFTHPEKDSKLSFDFKNDSQYGGLYVIPKGELGELLEYIQDDSLSLYYDAKPAKSDLLSNTTSLDQFMKLFKKHFNKEGNIYLSELYKAYLLDEAKYIELNKIEDRKPK